MNYLDIVLMGYKTSSDFPQHIYREYKKAITNHYSIKEFFDGCNNAIAHMASLIDDLYYRHIERLSSLINVIENDKNRSEEQKEIEIERVNKEIQLIDKNNFGTPLLFLSNNRLTGHLFYNDIGLMMHGVQAAILLATKDQLTQSLPITNNVSIDIKEVFNQEVTEDRKAKLYADLDKIEGIPAKIAFLENEKITYQQNIPFETFEASGKLIAGGFPSGALFFDRFIELEIEKLKKQMERLTENREPYFKSIFNPNNNSFEVCMELLDDLQITINGEPRLTKGRMGNLSGAIVAMKETPHFFKQEFTEMDLLKYFNAYLRTDYKTLSKRNAEYESSLDDTRRFIKGAFKK